MVIEREIGGADVCILEGHLLEKHQPFKNSMLLGSSEMLHNNISYYYSYLNLSLNECALSYAFTSYHLDEGEMLR